MAEGARWAGARPAPRAPPSRRQRVAFALFFFRYWERTRDRLFAILALTFTLLALERIVLAFVSHYLEGRHWIFVARLLAFVLILIGIIDKNRPHRRGSEPLATPSRSSTA